MLIFDVGLTPIGPGYLTQVPQMAEIRNTISRLSRDLSGSQPIGLPVSDVEQRIKFYATDAVMQVMHRHIDAEAGVTVVWPSDCTRPPQPVEQQPSYDRV